MILPKCIKREAHIADLKIQEGAFVPKRGEIYLSDGLYLVILDVDEDTEGGPFVWVATAEIDYPAGSDEIVIERRGMVIHTWNNFTLKTDKINFSAWIDILTEKERRDVIAKIQNSDAEVETPTGQGKINKIYQDWMLIRSEDL